MAQFNPIATKFTSKELLAFVAVMVPIFGFMVVFASSGFLVLNSFNS